MSTTVLFVGGTGRSGSTVLANALGEADGYVSVGEVRFLWERGIGENRLCGCGEHFSDCPFWTEVLLAAYPDRRPDTERVLDALARETQMRSLPRHLVTDRNSKALQDLLRPLYQAIADVSGASVVVDSSKLPTYARLIDTTDGLDVRLLHLVRDPRAAAFSWKRVKELHDRGSRSVMERRGVAKSAALWATWNWSLERMWRDRQESYHRLRYEDFVTSPRDELMSIMPGLGLTGEPWRALTGPRTLATSMHHTVAGNPGRMAQGETVLRLDDQWSAEMPARARLLVELITGAQLRHYGYLRGAGDPGTGDAADPGENS